MIKLTMRNYLLSIVILILKSKLNLLKRSWKLNSVHFSLQWTKIQNKGALEQPNMCSWCWFFQHNPPWPCWRVFSFIYLYCLESKCQFVYISEDVNSPKPDSILMLQFYNTCCVYWFWHNTMLTYWTIPTA